MAWTNVKGFNFRNTSGFVTDGTNETFDLGAAYPRSVTIDGDTFNVGWDTSIAANTRDRSATADRRMAGIAFRTNSTAGVNKWRIDLPSAGQYTVRVAMGDHDNPRTNILYRILDNTTAISTVGSPGVATVADGFADAQGNAWGSEAAWISSNVAVTGTWATTTFFLEIGDASGINGDISVVAHLDIVQVSAGTTQMMLDKRNVLYFI